MFKKIEILLVILFMFFTLRSFAVSPGAAPAQTQTQTQNDMQEIQQNERWTQQMKNNRQLRPYQNQVPQKSQRQPAQ